MAKKSPFRSGRSLEVLYENVEILTGQRGNGLYKAVTEKEVASIKGTINKVIIGSAGNSGDNELIEPPHAPKNVQAFGGFSAILVQWDNPTFKGYAHAEVWRASENNFSQAVHIATTPANVFSDVVNAGSTFYYWVRFVNKNNIAGPYNNVNGVGAETSSDVADIIDDLANQLQNSDVFQALQGEVDNKASVDALELANADIESAKKELNETIQDLAQSDAMLQSLTQTVFNAAKVMAMQIQQLNAAYRTVSEGETAVSNARFTESSQALADAEKALTQQISMMESSFNTNLSQTNAALTSLQQTVANNDSSMSQRVDTVEAKANTANKKGDEAKAAAQTNSQAIATINKDGSTAFKALWAAKAQAGDITAGIGIVAKSDGTSQVAVSASQFFVYDPNKPGALVPTFAIDQGKVVIPTAMIEKATIQILNSQQITADFVRASIQIVSPSIQGGDITGSIIRIGAGGPYAGYNFYVDAQGNASMRNAWIEGHVVATSGSFKGHVEAQTGHLSKSVTSDAFIVAGKELMIQAFGYQWSIYWKYGTFGWTALGNALSLSLPRSKSVKVTAKATLGTWWEVRSR